MQTIPFKLTTLLLMIVPLFLAAHNGKWKGKHTKEKIIKKEFEVDMNALLKVDNSYGNLHISSWTENRVLIEVHIKANGNNEEKVQQKLDEIRIAFENTASRVSAKTIFNDNYSWGWGNNSNVNIQINYAIKIPVKNNVNLDNDYGSIIIDRIDGHAKINCDYGRLDIGELRGRNNQLNFDYTSKSRIAYMNSGEVSADYSDFTIYKAGDLNINADYTDSTVQEMGNLVYHSDYGKIDIGEAGNVQGNGDYINVNLGTLHGDVDIDGDYGSVHIAKMAADAGNLHLKTDYTGIKIGYDPEYHFNFEISTSYAGVSGKENFEMNISEVKDTSKYYKGYYGSANSGNSVSINSDYGGITFYKN